MKLFAWNPRSLQPPVPLDTYDIPTVQRTSEMIKFRVLSFEYAVAPSGWLRELISVCLAVALVVAVPALLVLPILLIAANLIKAILLAILSCLLAAVGIVIVGAILFGLLFGGKR